jgi:hypothetical protein
VPKRRGELARGRGGALAHRRPQHREARKRRGRPAGRRDGLALFASAWGQYDGVDEVDKDVRILAQAPASVWADVTWSFHGARRERMCYQLVPGPDGLQIAVLTRPE